MLPIEIFRHCPRCGSKIDKHALNPLECKYCDFTYFFNPTVAAGAFIHDDAGRVLFVIRAKEPSKGLLGVPGGFIDPGETAEEALSREVREEVNLEIIDVRFLCSSPNHYLYREVTYPVCDLMFTARAIAPETAEALDGVASFVWHYPATLTDDELAFPSLKNARRLLLKGGKS